MRRELITTVSRSPGGGDKPATTKTDAQVKNEIAAIIKQITASCTYLPMLEDSCECRLAYCLRVTHSRP